MASRDECLEAYNFVGLSNIKHIPNDDMIKIIEDKREQRLKKEKIISSDESLLLINALRCNVVCDDNDNLFECSEKFRIYFEQVDAYELYNKLLKDKDQLFERICFLIVPIPNEDEMEDTEYIIKPVIKDRYIYNKLIDRDNFVIDKIFNIKINSKSIIIPKGIDLTLMNFIVHIDLSYSNIINEKKREMDDEWIIDELLDWFPLD